MAMMYSLKRSGVLRLFAMDDRRKLWGIEEKAEKTGQDFSAGRLSRVPRASLLVWLGIADRKSSPIARPTHN